MANIEGKNIEASLRRTWRISGALVDGVAGTLFGIAEAGDLLIRYDAGNVKLYQNTNTQASPTWTEKLAGGAALSVDVGDMAAAGTGAGNVLGNGTTSAPINHVHALGTHVHDGATTGGQLGPAAFAANIFTADAAGRAPFTDGIWTTAKLAAGVLSADATGRALIAANFFDSATVTAKFADSSIPAAKVNFTAGGTPTTITPDAGAAAGTGPGLAYYDHTHAITGAAPSGYSLAASDAEGAGNNFSRSSHVHKAILANNVWFVGRNQADGADLNLFKANASDLLEFGVSLAAATMAGTLTLGAQQLSLSTGNITFSGAGYIAIGVSPASAGSIRIPNNTYAILARNFAAGADVSIVKVNASDLIEFGASLAATTMGATLTLAAQQISFSTGNITFSGAGYIAIGVSPALSRSLRIPNDTPVWAARNQAAGADIDGWKVNATDDYEAAADVNLAGNKLYGGTAANADLDLNATIHATVLTAYILTRQMVDATVNSIAIRVKAGAIGDGETAQTDLNGEMGIDSTNGRLYFRYGAAWHYTAITAGFQIPADEVNCPKCSQPMSVGQQVIGRLNQVMSDGALHGLYEHMACPA